jgi:hypothetical protein
MSDDLVKQYREVQAYLNHGCSDGYCVIERQKGQHTNGGCRCLMDLDYIKRQRFGQIMTYAQFMAVRIEELETKLGLALEVLTNAEKQLQNAADYWDELCNDAARAPFTAAVKQARATIVELKE